MSVALEPGYGHGPTADETRQPRLGKSEHHLYPHDGHDARDGQRKAHEGDGDDGEQRNHDAESRVPGALEERAYRDLPCVGRSGLFGRLWRLMLRGRIRGPRSRTAGGVFAHSVALQTAENANDSERRRRPR
jgi:hypothetical protein